MATTRPRTTRLTGLGPRALTVTAAALVLVAGCGSTTEQTASSPTQPPASPSEGFTVSPSDGPTASLPSDGSTASPPGDDADTSTATEDPIVTTLPDDASSTKSPFDPQLPTGDVPPGVQDRPEVQAAVADLAQRVEVEESEVRVAGYAEVTWSDGSIGCPKPGMMYTQALVPGHQLVLEADGRLFSYHAAAGGAFSYCADPSAPAQGGSTS